MIGRAPNIFTFAELTVLADGRRFVRLWDASMFPRHALYLDGLRRDSTELEYQPRQLYNANFIAFLAEASTRLVTPYYAPEWAYKLHVTENRYVNQVEDVLAEWIDWIPDADGDDFPTYSEISHHDSGGPILRFGTVGRDGPEISSEAIDALLPESPLWPFE